MKKLFFILFGLVALIIVVSAVLPKDFKIEQQIIINKPASEIYAYLKSLKKANEWSPWDKKDAKMTKDFSGTDGEVGSIASWSGNREVGVGAEEITGLTQNKRIDFELRFEKPMKATNKGYFELEQLSNTQTKVTWSVSGKTPMPFNIICHFMQKKANQDFTDGLENIKRNLEK